jgi:hypothetical protein
MRLQSPITDGSQTHNNSQLANNGTLTPKTPVSHRPLKQWPDVYFFPTDNLPSNVKEALENKRDLTLPSERYKRGILLQTLIDDGLSRTLYPDTNQKRDMARSIIVAFPHLRETVAGNGYSGWYQSVVDALKNKRRTTLKNEPEVRAHMKKKFTANLPIKSISGDKSDADENSEDGCSGMDEAAKHDNAARAKKQKTIPVRRYKIDSDNDKKAKKAKASEELHSRASKVLKRSLMSVFQESDEELLLSDDEMCKASENKTNAKIDLVPESEEGQNSHDLGNQISKTKSRTEPTSIIEDSDCGQVSQAVHNKSKIYLATLMTFCLCAFPL